MTSQSRYQTLAAKVITQDCPQCLKCMVTNVYERFHGVSPLLSLTLGISCVFPATICTRISDALSTLKSSTVDVILAEVSPRLAIGHRFSSFKELLLHLKNQLTSVICLSTDVACSLSRGLHGTVEGFGYIHTYCAVQQLCHIQGDMVGNHIRSSRHC